jgi:hypothetical protein
MATLQATAIIFSSTVQNMRLSQKLVNCMGDAVSSSLGGAGGVYLNHSVQTISWTHSAYIQNKRKSSFGMQLTTST